MLLNLLEYHWAEDIDDALLLLSRTDIKTVPLAGGTYLLGQADENILAVVDLRDLQLSYIEEDAQAIRIGAMTTLQSIADAPALKNIADGLLSRAAQASSFSRLVRNSATLGGTLGAGAASQADLLTALSVMDSEVVVRSGSQTSVNLGAGSLGSPSSDIVYKGKQERRIAFHSFVLEHRPNELIIEVRIPRPGTTASGAFQRVGRTPTDVALLNAAALIEVQDDVYRRVRLALGGVNMEPVRLYTVEQQLEGQPVVNTDDWARHIGPILQTGMADFRPPSDFRASSDYRRMCGTTLAYRVLEEATNGSRWRGKFSGKRA